MAKIHSNAFLQHVDARAEAGLTFKWSKIPVYFLDGLLIAVGVSGLTYLAWTYINVVFGLLAFAFICVIGWIAHPLIKRKEVI